MMTGKDLCMEKIAEINQTLDFMKADQNRDLGVKIISETCRDLSGALSLGLSLPYRTSGPFASKGKEVMDFMTDNMEALLQMFGYSAGSPDYDSLLGKLTRLSESLQGRFAECYRNGEARGFHGPFESYARSGGGTGEAPDPTRPSA